MSRDSRQEHRPPTRGGWTSRHPTILEQRSCIARRRLSGLLLPLEMSSRNPQPFARYLLTLRQALRWPGEPITFSHHGDDMIFRQVMMVSSPNHDAEMALIVTVGFDDDGKVRSFFVQPEDQGLFDHVLKSVVARSSEVL